MVDLKFLAGDPLVDSLAPFLFKSFAVGFFDKGIVFGNGAVSSGALEGSCQGINPA